MVALVDMDDTLVSLQRDILTYINQFCTVPYSWDRLSRDLREGKDEQYQKLVVDFLSQPELSLRARIYPSASQALKSLKDSGWQIHIASARKENLHHVTEAWLRQHQIHHYIDLIHPRFSNFKSTEFKVKVAQKIGATVAFDDTYDVALALAEAGVKTYLLDKPWNKNERLHPNMRRARNFAEAVRRELATNRQVLLPS